MGGGPDGRRVNVQRQRSSGSAWMGTPGIWTANQDVYYRAPDAEFGPSGKPDLSLIYPTDPKQLPAELKGVVWPPP